VLTWRHGSTRARHRAPCGTARREAPVGAFEAEVARGENPRADLSVCGRTRREAFVLGDSTWPPQLRRAPERLRQETFGSTAGRRTHRAEHSQVLVRRGTGLGEAPDPDGRLRRLRRSQTKGPNADREVVSGFRLVQATDRPPGRAGAAHPPCSQPGFDARYATDAVATPWPCRVRRIPVRTLVDVKKSVETKPKPPLEHLLRELPSGRTVRSLLHRVSTRSPLEDRSGPGLSSLTESPFGVSPPGAIPRTTPRRARYWKILSGILWRRDRVEFLAHSL
jgi:hypothetical protein